MRRLTLPPRPNWRRRLSDIDFDWHTGPATLLRPGRPYWQEGAAYALTNDEAAQLREAAETVHACATQLIPELLADPATLTRLGLPEHWHGPLRASWDQQEPRERGGLYGRLDFALTPQGPRLLEYNADTPTTLVEAAQAQVDWLHDRALNAQPFGDLHGALSRRFQTLRDTSGPRLHLTGDLASTEDHGTLRYFARHAQDAGFQTTLLDITQLGVRQTFTPTLQDPSGGAITQLLKLYPWEWLIQESDDTNQRLHLLSPKTSIIQPLWRGLLSNKALLALLHGAYPTVPYILPAALCDDYQKAPDLVGPDAVYKPLVSRAGQNVYIYQGGALTHHQPGMYRLDQGVAQQYAPLPTDDQGRSALLGVWMVAGQACGLSVRESQGPITLDGSLFTPSFVEDHP
jgi:glutathionylspermidine synthase